MIAELMHWSRGRIFSSKTSPKLISVELPKFRHDPLNLAEEEIRVLEILPERSSSGLISCRITHQRAEIGNHTCLSYTWGEPKPSVQILINGGIFSIQQNLYNFLTNAQTEGLLLWVDAVCIDQNESTERNHQVRLMNKIYSNAESVLLWLGTGDPNIERMLKATSLADEKPEDLRDIDHYSLPHTESDRDAFDRLCAVSYWERVWVVQEILLARQVELLYGHGKYDWQAFRDLVFRGSHDSPALRFCKLSKWCHAPSVHGDLPVLLEDFTPFKCTDFHDKVYGILGLLKGGESYPVDYNVTGLELIVVTALYYVSGDDLRSEHVGWQQDGLGIIMENLFFSSLQSKLDAPEIDGTNLQAPKVLERRFRLLLVAKVERHHEPNIRPGQLFTRAYCCHHIDLSIQPCYEKRCAVVRKVVSKNELPASCLIFEVQHNTIRNLGYHLVITQRIYNVERIVARVFGTRGTTRWRSKKSLEPVLERYDDPLLFGEGLPGAMVVKHIPDKLEDPAYLADLCVDNTYTEAILFNLPECQVLREKVLGAMVARQSGKKTISNTKGNRTNGKWFKSWLH